MAEKFIQPNTARLTFDDLAHQIMVLQQSLKQQTNVVDELLNRPVNDIDVKANSQTFDIVKDIGPQRTTFFINDKNPDGDQLIKGELPSGTPITTDSYYCWFIAEYVFDDGAWIAPATSYGCYDKRAYNEGWTGSDGSSYAVWTVRGGTCQAKEDCAEWAANQTPPQEPPFDGESISEDNTSKSSSGDLPVSISESSSESETAEFISACAEGDDLCEGADCAEGQNYSAMFPTYLDCHNAQEAYMEQMVSDCEDGEDTWKHCGWTDYIPCVYGGGTGDSDLWYYYFTACCCELEECPPPTGLENRYGSTIPFENGVSITASCTNITTCSALGQSMSNPAGYENSKGTRLTISGPLGSWSKSATQWNENISATASPYGWAIGCDLEPGETMTVTVTRIFDKDGGPWDASHRWQWRGDSRLTTSLA